LISQATASFWKCLNGLPRNDLEAANKAYTLFMRDSGHRSLRFKKLEGHSNVWSVRVTLDLRAVAHRDGDTVTWFWIGTHKEFDHLFA
jgi:hypothetical protein